VKVNRGGAGMFHDAKLREWCDGFVEEKPKRQIERKPKAKAGGR